MPTHTGSTFVSSVLLIVGAIVVAGCQDRPQPEAESTAMAGPAQHGSDTKTKDALEKDGYSCETMGAGGYICTKNGSSYWCDRKSNKCIKRQDGQGGIPIGDITAAAAAELEQVQDQQMVSDGSTGAIQQNEIERQLAVDNTGSFSGFGVALDQRLYKYWDAGDEQMSAKSCKDTVRRISPRMLLVNSAFVACLDATCDRLACQYLNECDGETLTDHEEMESASCTGRSKTVGCEKLPCQGK